MKEFIKPFKTFLNENISKNISKPITFNWKFWGSGSGRHTVTKDEITAAEKPIKNARDITIGDVVYIGIHSPMKHGYVYDVMGMGVIVDQKDVDGETMCFMVVLPELNDHISDVENIIAPIEIVQRDHNKYLKDK